MTGSSAPPPARPATSSTLPCAQQPKPRPKITELINPKTTRPFAMPSMHPSDPKHLLTRHPHTPSPTDLPATDDLLHAFTGPIAPIRVGIPYKLGLLLAAVTMILLPVIYLALILLTIYAIYWYAVHASIIFDNPAGARIKLFIFLAPIFGGLTLLLFMIKPLLARRIRRSTSLALSRSEQLRLYKFVDLLCEAVRAPKPARINIDMDVNASASFAHGA